MYEFVFIAPVYGGALPREVKKYMNRTTQIFATLLLATCATSAVAQDQEKPEKIVLEQKNGSVMASTGGQYETADIGQILIRDETLMLTDGAKATVVYYYDNGKRKCVEKYEGPNTFVIDESCKKAVYWEGNGRMSAGIIAAGALLGVAIISSTGKNEQFPPASAGRR